MSVLFSTCLFFLSFAGEKRLQDLPVLAFDIQIATVQDGQVSPISEATIIGRPGSDFEVRLEDDAYKMVALYFTHFLPQKRVLLIKADLQTRRFYGMSERKLPLFEEDNQVHDLEIGIGDRIVLFPFGRESQGQQLRIQASARIVREADTQDRPLEITINNYLGAAYVKIKAFHVPHLYTLSAALLCDHQVVAEHQAILPLRTRSNLPISFAPAGSNKGQNHPHLNLDITLTPSVLAHDLNEIEIDYRLDFPQAQPQTALVGAGIFAEGQNILLDLPIDALGEANRNYQLQLNVQRTP